MALGRDSDTTREVREIRIISASPNLAQLAEGEAHPQFARRASRAGIARESVPLVVRFALDDHLAFVSFLPAFDPAFVQQLWLAIVDKLALGVILVVVGYLANRKLEDYRAHRSLTTEVSKRRVALVGDIVEKTMEVEVAYLERTFLLIQALVDESRRAGRSDLPAVVEWDVEQAMDIAIQMGDDVQLLAGADERVVAKLAEANANVDSALKDVHRLLAASRFWLGSATHRQLMAQVMAIRGLFDQLQPNAASFARFRKSYAGLIRERGDAESFLASLASR